MHSLGRLVEAPSWLAYWTKVGSPKNCEAYSVLRTGSRTRYGAVLCERQILSRWEAEAGKSGPCPALQANSGAIASLLSTKAWCCVQSCVRHTLSRLLDHRTARAEAIEACFRGCSGSISSI